MKEFIVHEPFVAIRGYSICGPEVDFPLAGTRRTGRAGLVRCFARPDYGGRDSWTIAPTAQM